MILPFKYHLIPNTELDDIFLFPKKISKRQIMSSSFYKLKFRGNTGDYMKEVLSNERIHYSKGLAIFTQLILMFLIIIISLMFWFKAELNTNALQTATEKQLLSSKNIKEFRYHTAEYIVDQNYLATMNQTMTHQQKTQIITQSLDENYVKSYLLALADNMDQFDSENPQVFENIMLPKISKLTYDSTKELNQYALPTAELNRYKSALNHEALDYAKSNTFSNNTFADDFLTTAHNMNFYIGIAAILTIFYLVFDYQLLRKKKHSLSIIGSTISVASLLSLILILVKTDDLQIFLLKLFASNIDSKFLLNSMQHSVLIAVLPTIIMLLLGISAVICSFKTENK